MEANGEPVAGASGQLGAEGGAASGRGRCVARAASRVVARWREMHNRGKPKDRGEREAAGAAGMVARSAAACGCGYESDSRGDDAYVWYGARYIARPNEIASGATRRLLRTNGPSNPSELEANGAPGAKCGAG